MKRRRSQNGAGTMRILFRVLLPLARPGIAAVGFYTFMISLESVLVCLDSHIDERQADGPRGIITANGFLTTYQWNQIMAMSVLGCLPVVILSLIFQRHFVSGLSSGSVKA